MIEDCLKCQEYRDEGKKFCGVCGKDLEEEKRPSILFILAIVSAIVLGILLVIEVISLFINFIPVLNEMPTLGADIIFLVPTVKVLFTLEGIWAQIYWILIFSAIVASVAWMAYDLYKKMKEYKIDRDIKSVEKSGFFNVCYLFTTLLVIEMAYILVAMSLGVDINNPFEEEATINMKYALANAAVWEEVITRVAMIGLPVALISFYKTRQTKSCKALLGGFGIDRTVLILLIASSIMFGIGHSGWGVWKIFLTMLGGFVMGYIYAQYGLYASIVFHFITDYMMAITWLGAGDIGMALLTLAILGAGAIALPYLVKKLISLNKETFSKMKWFND